MANWNEMLREIFAERGDDFSQMVCTVGAEQLNAEFDDGYGSENGCAFTAWGDNYVYFPICYDGAEWVGSAPRNPCDESLSHQGGG